VPLYRICTRSGELYPGERCECQACRSWQRFDDARRNNRRKAQGKNTQEWTRFAARVKERDNYRCVECGASSNLTVHYKHGGPHTSRNLDDYETRCRRHHGSIDAPRARR
jgi:thymidine kinase